VITRRIALTRQPRRKREEDPRLPYPSKISGKSQQQRRGGADYPFFKEKKKEKGKKRKTGLKRIHTEQKKNKSIRQLIRGFQKGHMEGDKCISAKEKEKELIRAPGLSHHDGRRRGKGKLSLNLTSRNEKKRKRTPTLPPPCREEKKRRKPATKTLPRPGRLVLFLNLTREKKKREGSSSTIWGKKEKAIGQTGGKRDSPLCPPEQKGKKKKKGGKGASSNSRTQEGGKEL